MKYLFTFLKQKRAMVILTLLLLTGQVVGTLLIPYLIAQIVDKGILTGNLSAIYGVGIQMLVVSLLTAVISIGGCYLSAELAISFGCNMRNAIFRQSQRLSLGQFDEVGVSSMLTRSTSDITNIQQTMVMVLQMMIPAPLIITVCILMTIHINPSLAIISVIGILFFIVLSFLIFGKLKPLSRQIQIKMDRINMVLRESITGIRVIRAFNNGIYEKERSDTAFEGYAIHMIKLNKLFAILNPCIWLLMGLSMAATTWFGGILSANGSIHIGQITAVVEYSIITLSYMILAIMSGVTLPKMRACLERLTQVLDIKPEIQDDTTACSTKSTSIPLVNTPVVEFSHVTFSYPGAEEPVLTDISFCCRSKETTAIIGSTGSGKSTIANLLLRLHDINDGSILFNGRNITTIPQEALRDSIGYTPQKAILFSGTIAENLHMGNASASLADMEDALEIAQALPFIQQLPLGLNGLVSQNGSNFSGGQKQRLAIARSIIKNAPLLIFDDSFSALDARTDASLRDALHQYVPDTAKIIIAQRIQTIANADQIIVLDEGRIAGIGTHQTLMKSCDVYRSIAQSQFSAKEVSSFE